MSRAIPRAAVLTGPALFATEIAEARRLGYRIGPIENGNVITVRLIPMTAHAQAAAQQAAGPHIPSAVIHAACPVPTDATSLDRLDVMRDTLRTAIGLARDAA